MKQRPVQTDPRGRHHPVALSGARITFRCPCGREYEVDFGRRPVARRLSPTAAQMMFGYWSRGGVSSPPCKACQRARRETGALPPAARAAVHEQRGGAA